MNFISKIMSGAFGKVLLKDQAGTNTLGNPLGRDSGPFLARMNNMSIMRGGKGFTTPKMKPRTNHQGLTRGDRRRIRRQWAADAEREIQEKICRQMSVFLGSPYDDLKVQFGSL